MAPIRDDDSLDIVFETSGGSTADLKAIPGDRSERSSSGTNLPTSLSTAAAEEGKQARVNTVLNCFKLLIDLTFKYFLSPLIFFLLF